MKLFSVFILAALCGCQTGADKTADIIIEGNIAGLPDAKLYLVEARKWKTPLDSAESKNGRFVFRISSGSSFTPYLAAIHFLYNGDADKPVRLQFRNHLLADSLQHLRDAFYLEKGVTSITGTIGASPYLRISAGKETELFFRYQLSDIGWPGTGDTLFRYKQWLVLQNAIKENPSSFFLLQSIYDSRTLYGKEEIKKLLSVFSDSIKQSAPGKIFGDYLSLRPDAGAPYPNLALLSAANNQLAIIDTTAQVNMLVFWASWCTPCRNEIPLLKDLFKKYSSKKFRLVNISIDQNRQQWLTALKQEQMPWLQLIIAKDRIEEVQNIFSFTTIPFTVFTDRHGKELARLDGYDPINFLHYERLIKRFAR